jgi:hypothetical protein
MHLRHREDQRTRARETTMLDKLGVNLDYRNLAGRPDASDLSIFAWARLVARHDEGLPRYVVALRAAGIRTVLLLAGESFAGGDRREEAAEYARTIRSDCWQIGNEPDLVSPSSWTMAPAAYAALAHECADGIRSSDPASTVVAAGLASGDPTWLDECGDLPVDGIAVHPYGQRSESTWPAPNWGFGNVGDLLDRYAAHAKPLWITEFGTDDASVHADYYARLYLAVAQRADVAAALAFCYSDGMVPGFGLVDTAGNRKPAFDRLAEAVARR